MHKQMLRTDLLASFQQLQKQFDSSLAKANEFNVNFSSAYNQFQINLSGLLAEMRVQFSDTSPLKHSLTEFISGLEEMDRAWKTKLQNQDKGLSFRKNFEDSLLVYVYGKVKSGKSSLGNYIAWGHTDPNSALQQQSSSVLEYESYENTSAENGDIENEAVHNKKFRVGATEATSTIQTFRLPGLTWVDSPGLHSVRQENGELAKAHAEHADLILYTMSSSAPGRSSDLEEIKELFEKEKNIMLLLTGSDTKEFDYDDDKDEEIELVVMKSVSIRQSQREFVIKQLKEMKYNTDKIEILSISARYAELNADNPQAIQDSGMGDLFSKLNHISQNDGVRMKRAVPLRNFKNFLMQCREDVKQYYDLTNDFKNKIADLNQSIPKLSLPKIMAAKGDMRNIIDRKFDELAKHRDNEQKFNATFASAQTTWNKDMNILLDETLNNILTDVLADFKAAVSSVWSSSSISLPAFSIEKVIQKIPDGCTRGTKKRNSGLGALIGGGAGLFLGPIGGAVGSMVGAAIGSMIGDSAEQRTRSIEIAVNDNLNELRDRVIQLYTDDMEQGIKTQIKTLFDELLTNMSNSCAILSDEIKNFEHVVTALEKNVEQQLSLKAN